MLRNGELGETGQNQRSVLRQDLKNVRLYFPTQSKYFLLLAQEELDVIFDI